jgi:hypothetical protein
MHKVKLLKNKIQYNYIINISHPILTFEYVNPENLVEIVPSCQII